MNRFLALIVLSLMLGCRAPNPMDKTNPSSETRVQLFNEAVLGSSPTDPIPMLLTSADADWSPRQVVLDYNDDACYGAMVHYDRSQPFEVLRSAINSRFGKDENPPFANDPKMGSWRMEDAGFAIQLSDDEEMDSYMAIYLLFVDPATMATKLNEMSETEPELFEDLPLDELTDAMRGSGAGNTTPTEGE